MRAKSRHHRESRPVADVLRVFHVYSLENGPDGGVAWNQPVAGQRACFNEATPE